MNESEMIQKYVASRIAFLSSGSPAAKGALAKLRRGAGKDIRDDFDSWEFVLEGLPEELTGYGGGADFRPSMAERAIHAALTLFSVHMQGRTTSASDSSRSFATACRSQMDRSSSDGVKRRFDAIVTASTIDEMEHHARGMVQLMRSSDMNSGFDYPHFAVDLYYFQFPEGRRNTMLRWGQDFYVKPFDKEESEDE